MTKFTGVIGYALQSEVGPGVWKDVIIERSYRGDVLQNVLRWKDAEQQVNDDLMIDNRISVLSDSYMQTNLGVMKYVNWDGTRWKISKIEQRRPRIILSLGGVYNGPTP